MKNPAATPYELPTEIVDRLARTRRYLRRYLWQLLGLRLVTLGAAIFLAAWSLDYLPIWFGGRELGLSWRLGLLVLAIAACMATLWRDGKWLFRTRPTDDQVAGLIERRLPEINGGLLTVVSAAKVPGGSSDNSLMMLRCTEARTLEALKNFEEGTLFDARVLTRASLAAVGAVALLMALAVAMPATFQTAAARLLWLDSRDYPRRFAVSLAAIRWRQDDISDFALAEQQSSAVDEAGVVYVARGTSLTVVAEVQRESASADTEARFPDCEFVYRSESGLGGRVLLKRVGPPRDGRQTFELDSPPLDQIGHDLRFSLRCGDHQAGPFFVRAVDPPSVREAQLDCVFPDYMVDRESLRWTPRTIPWSVGTKLPQGTTLTLCGTASATLKRAVCVDQTDDARRGGAEGRGRELSCADTGFQWAIGRLEKNVKGKIYLVDRCGVVSREPFAITIEAVADQPPRIVSKLEGIGLAITPQAVIPIRGTVQDDYGVDSSWAEIGVTESETVAVPLELDGAGVLSGSIDLRLLQDEQRIAKLEPGERRAIQLVVKAKDRCDLNDQPNRSAGEMVRLELVTPNELIRLLERRESAERRRLEQIHEELSRARDYLARLAQSRETATMPNGASENDDRLATEEREGLDRESRAIYASRLRLQLDKSAAEISGAADVLEDLRLQLANNRLNAREREARLSDKVVRPLRSIVDELKGSLRESSRTLQAQFQQYLQQPLRSRWEVEISQTARAADEQFAATLGKLEQVIQTLVKFETQNELIDLVRSMLKKQTELYEKTRELRKQEAFEGLLD